jgi:hypothetical protein
MYPWRGRGNESSGRYGVRWISVLILIALGCGLWMAVGRRGEVAGERTEKDPGDFGMRAQVEGRLSILSSAPVHLPRDVRELLLREPHQRTWGAARLLLRAPWPVWLIGRGRRLCLLSQEVEHGAVASTCASRARVLRRGLFLTALRDAYFPGGKEWRVTFGVVPDHVHSVEILTDGFPVDVASARGNVFLARDNILQPPRALGFNP